MNWYLYVGNNTSNSVGQCVQQCANGFYPSPNNNKCYKCTDTSSLCSTCIYNQTQAQPQCTSCLPNSITVINN